MMTWRDVGAGLGAASAAMLRWDLWFRFLGRALFSRVFAGFLLFALITGFVIGLSSPVGRGANWGQGLALILLFNLPWLGFALLGLLLPYLCWSFHPLAARTLAEILGLPPAEVPSDPPFRRYLQWGLPIIGWSVAAILVRNVPIPSRGFVNVIALACTAMAYLAAVTLSIRSALSGYYTRDAVEGFLTATRWRRIFIWSPVLFAAGFVLQLAIVFITMKLSRLLAGPLSSLGLNLLLQATGSTLVTCAFIGALLQGCGRFRDDLQFSPTIPVGAR